MTEYEVIIGLEVHVELSTESKIFCGCPTAFGGDPNTHVCAICSGMPGTLPTLNRDVLRYAVRAGLATHCDITRNGKFDRKNYFYPDLPKAYQISQLYLPICRNGYIEIGEGDARKKIRIHEMHMEEDAGKLIHDVEDKCTLVDYNRCGVPLIEIVSEPDFRSAEEVVDYLERLKTTLQYIGVSDCKMQEGSMRADINLSVRPIGEEKLGTRTEMKNMASLKAIARAIEAESKRQIERLRTGKTIKQQTRRWDDEKGVSFSMRTKENAHDYKYFPEPDLLPLQVSPEMIAEIAREIPELKEVRKERYVRELSLPEYDADILTGSYPLVRIFERTAEICGNPKEASNWIMTDLLKLMKDAQCPPEDLKIPEDALGRIISMVSAGQINRTVGRTVLGEVFESNVDPLEYVEKNGLAMVSDKSVIEDAIGRVLEENPKAVEDYRAGNPKSVQFLIGQSMRILRGKADPQAVQAILFDHLEKLR